MMHSAQPHDIGLATRGLFDIPDAAGIQIACRQGCLWVTLDDDPRDIVLEPGESFFSTEHRRALVYALQDSTLALRAHAQQASASPRPLVLSLRPT